MSYQLPDVKIGTTKLNKSKFSLNPQNSTSFGFGEVQPTLCFPMVPKSTLSVDLREIVRMGVLSVPTFGKIQQKHYARFVDYEDVWKPWKDYLDQAPHATETGSFIPTKVPYISVGYLSQFLLKSRNSFLQDSFRVSYCKYRVLVADTVGAATDQLQDSYENARFLEFTDEVGQNFADFKTTLDSCLVSMGSEYPQTRLYTTGVSAFPTNFFNSTEFSKEQLAENYLYDSYDWQGIITLENADVIVSLPLSIDDGTKCLIAIKWTKFGSNLLKILRGCGFKFDLHSSRPFEIPRLLAFFKAYFDTFVPANTESAYNSFANTACSKIIQYLDHNDVTNIAANNTVDTQFKNLLDALSACYYYDDPDFITAHIASPAIGMRSSSLSVNNPDSSSISLQPSTYFNFNSQPRNQSLSNGAVGLGSLTAPGLKLLMRMYKYVNKHTILGARVREFLKAEFGYECKDDDTYNVGFANFNISMSDIFSTSDTLSVQDGEVEGAALGQYGGKGLGYTGDQNNADSIKFKYTTDRHGYFFILSCIVPVSGRCQGYDPLVSRGTGSMYEIYDNMLDSLDFEITPKDALLGESFVTLSAHDDEGTARSIDRYALPFGFIPRMFPYKVQQNLLNGDFSKRGLRNTYMPYTLDNIITDNNINAVVDPTASTNERDLVYSKVELNDVTSDLPTATPELRSLGKYSWFGNYYRIFMTSPIEEIKDNFYAGLNEGSLLGRDDDFLCHIAFNNDYFANMKPASESFETDGEDDSTMSVKKG